jgi:integrase
MANAGHHSALPVGEIEAFMKTLRSQAGISAQSLEFTILTAARSGEVRGARWAEIDLDAATWTVPGDRMKAGKEHRGPLSDTALAILNTLPHEDRNALVFASPRGGRLSDMSLTAVLRRMKVDAVPHGFRSSFRDWCAGRTNYPREVAEMALAHAIGDKVEAAYRRGDLFEKRRRLMKDWAAFCANPEVGKGSVISMNAARP